MYFSSIEEAERKIEQMSNFRKHQLYTGRYVEEDEKVLTLKDECKWKAVKFGWRPVNSSNGEIALILHDPEMSVRGFYYWSVLSFLTEDEAKQLKDELEECLSEREEEVKNEESV